MTIFSIDIISQNGRGILGEDARNILMREFDGYTAAGAQVEFSVPDTMPQFSLQDAGLIAGALIKSGCKSYNCEGLSAVNHAAASDEPLHIDTPPSVFCTSDNAGFVKASELLRKRILEKHIKGGVLFLNPDSSTIGFNVSIAAGTVVYPNNYIGGNTAIGSDCTLMPNNIINDSAIGNGCKITASTLEGARVSNNSCIGPNAYLRPGSIIGSNCKIGDFVEIKNAKIGDGTKISHLTYVGDATLGSNINVGCGVVFVNYNGKIKSHTTVGDNTFIGCNCNLVAPVNIGKNCFIAAGTTVTKNLNDQDFCIGRSEQTIKPGKAHKYLAGLK